MHILIHNKQYKVNEHEYTRIQHKEYNNLKLYENLGNHERIVGLIQKCKEVFTLEPDFISCQTQYGGFIPINLATHFAQIWLVDTADADRNNIRENMLRQNIGNIHFATDLLLELANRIVYSESSCDHVKNGILITKERSSRSDTSAVFGLSGTDYYIHVADKLIESFFHTFRFSIEQGIDGNNVITYDNLLNLCIMVKNGGRQFEKMLIDNFPIIDKWTILDTGSNDETIDIIHRVLVGKKEGCLFQEPFINFRESRNRLLELAGTSCKLNIMLDDTYVVKGNLRDFLTEVRSDQYSNSFTLFVQSDDTTYGSNRIIRSDSGLRYIHKIHEVITDKNNINVVIPQEKVYIEDRRFDYMETRTMERKQLDLKLLYEEMDEDPNNPRTYYYLAQTYNLLQDYENAFQFFLKRASFTNSGFIQERVDALFEAARLANFQLGKPWEECKALYEQCYKVDESRPESLYFIGIHYYLEGNNRKAFSYFKKGFEIGFPTHCQYSLKPTLSFHFLPKFLSRICYELEEYKLGEEASRFFLANNNETSADYAEIVSWYHIFVKLNQYQGEKKVKTVSTYSKPLFVFVADGGFNPWSGSTILTTGVGGSETYIIEMARYIQKAGQFQTMVFCNTPHGSEEIFENTIYKPLSSYYEFINTVYVNTCIISRYSEYLPVTFKGFSENVYLVVHDLTPSGVVIPMDKKLKNVFCLTEWHAGYFASMFALLKPITVFFYYGIDGRFKHVDMVRKVKHKFIYSSFPNRGLLQLLQMWSTIIERVPTCTLHIYSDVYNKWSNDVEPTKMQQIRDLLASLSDAKYGIYYHGWVSKSELSEAWLTADIWFYPCTFMETFCLTALEAASSNTFVVTNDLAALQNTVGDRGCVIPGDATTTEWQQEALEKLFHYLIEDLDGKEKQHLLERNSAWATTLSWESQAKTLVDTYIAPHMQIEYKGMYNWTNDLPQGEKQIFLDVLHHFNQTYPKAVERKKIDVLEIGTYTGVSLIHIINAIPNAMGTGVDMWSSYNENNLLENMDALGVEQSFYKNVRTAGLTDRIKGLKSDSTDALSTFLKEGRRFDFIYVDGSHLLLDCYSDLVLAWFLLEQDGILAIDDYLYKHDSILESPFEAVNHFLKRYQGKYKLLHKSYRVFLQKV